MKQCVIVPYTVGDCFNNISRKFPALLPKEVTEFVLTFDELFERTMRPTERYELTSKVSL
jgi:hypothetical protein